MLHSLNLLTMRREHNETFTCFLINVTFLYSLIISYTFMLKGLCPIRVMSNFDFFNPGR